MFNRIVEVFPKASGHGVLFAFGDTIYNPSGAVIPPPLLAHEEVHGRRQTRNAGEIFRATQVERWWEQYLKDPEFRYDEELYAHVAEFKAQMPYDRNLRAKLLMSTAQRLIAPLYQYGIRSLNQAIRDLQREIESAKT
jgi:hypothetical protein